MAAPLSQRQAKRRHYSVRVGKDLNSMSVIADPCDGAESFAARLLGLMGRSHFENGGLWFPRCSSIHMWFMRVSIDVVFLKQKDKSDSTVFEVVKLHSIAKPWRLLPIQSGRADSVLELPAGTIVRNGIEVGDWVCIALR